MIEAILFDLDGTLLNVDMDDFLNRYLEKLAIHLSQFTDPTAFKKNLWAATGAMVQKKDPTATNQEAFLEHFYTWVQHPHEQVWPLVDEFYESVFPSLKGAACPYPHVDSVFELLRKENYRLVLATNPIFPRAAIVHRMEWCGVKTDDFALITTYENMHYTKPNPKYYLEIAEMINTSPENCLMIGNDPEFDIKPAAQAGMKTFLVDNTLTSLNSKEAHGRIVDIPEFLRMQNKDL